MLRAGVGLAFRRGRLQHVYNILRGKDLNTGEVSEERRTAQFSRLRSAQDDIVDLTNWHEFLKCLSQAGFRQNRMITSENAVIYTYALWLIGKRDFGVRRRVLRATIARWFFMAHTSGRYTSSPETQIESDLSRLSSLTFGDANGFCETLDGIVRSIFTGDYWDISLPQSVGYVQRSIPCTLRILGGAEHSGRGRAVQPPEGTRVARPGERGASKDRATSPVSEGVPRIEGDHSGPASECHREHGVRRLVGERRDSCQGSFGVLAQI